MIEHEWNAPRASPSKGRAPLAFCRRGAAGRRCSETRRGWAKCVRCDFGRWDFAKKWGAKASNIGVSHGFTMNNWEWTWFNQWIVDLGVWTCWIYTCLASLLLGTCYDKHQICGSIGAVNAQKPSPMTCTMTEQARLSNIRGRFMMVYKYTFQ